jgi:hypothetical protein
MGSGKVLMDDFPFAVHPSVYMAATPLNFTPRLAKNHDGHPIEAQDRRISIILNCQI